MALASAVETANKPAIPPKMSEAETRLLREQLAGSKLVVEFGAGGSTLIAARDFSCRLVTVESDKGWIEKLQAHPDVAAAIAAERLTLLHVDVGPTKGFGYPSDQATAIRWPDYYTKVWREVPFASSADLVFVDGRFRVACALQAVIRCQPGTRLLIHDFWDRPIYHPILSLTDYVASVDTMALLSVRDSVDPRKLGKLLTKFALITG